VLFSFFLSALLFGVVIFLGYWMESLPAKLLTSLDHYVLHMIRRRSLQFQDSEANTGNILENSPSEGILAESNGHIEHDPERDDETTATHEDSVNVKSVIDDTNVVRTHSNHAVISDRNEPPHRRLEFLLRIWVKNSTQQLALIKEGTYDDHVEHPLVAAKMVKWCAILFVFHATVLLYFGTTWDPGYSIFGNNPASISGFWIAWKVIPFGKRVLNQIYFVLGEIEQRKTNTRAPSTSPATVENSRSSVVPKVFLQSAGRGGRSLSSTSLRMTRTTTSDDDPNASPPSR
jgi:hypothetical protein